MPASLFWRFEMESFSHLHATLAGIVDGRMIVSDELMSGIPNARHAIASFARQITDGEMDFQSGPLFSQIPPVTLHWRPHGNAAGIAYLSCAAEPASDLVLLLGADASDNEAAAIRATEAWWKEQANACPIASIINGIQQAQRPLLASISQLPFAARTVHVEVIQWTFAAAFFQIVRTQQALQCSSNQY
jgi:hypothetical protein